MASEKTIRTINSILWIAQAILSASFLWAGTMKLFMPHEKLAAQWPWTGEHPDLVIMTGIIDLLAGIGLILPPLLRIQPRLTVYAAYGTILLMIAASVFHIARGEASLIGVNLFFLAFAVFIAWGRQTKAPIRPKQQ